MGSQGRLGEKVVVLLNADSDFASVVKGTASLSPVVSGIILPLESVGWNAADAPLQLINFVAADGTVKVSVIVPFQGIPRSISINVAAMIFEHILKEAPVKSPGFAIILAGTVPIPGSYQSKGADIVHEGMRLSHAEIQLAELNGCTESSKGIFGKLQKLPLDLQLRDEFLASLVHAAQVMHLPTALLLGPTSLESAAAEGKVKSELTAILAKQLDIFFDAAKYVSAARRDREGIREWQTALYI